MIRIMEFNKVFRRDALYRVRAGQKPGHARRDKARPYEKPNDFVKKPGLRWHLVTLYILCAMLVSLLLSVPASPTVHADGGAPNLAYVAGASGGVGVIDIGAQKVTSTIKLSGELNTVYLTLDGRFLYVTQPSANKVTMFATRTGQTICSASVPGQPSLLTFDAGTNILYVAGNGASAITGLDANNCAVKRTIKTSSPVYGLFVAIVGQGPSGGTENQLWASTSTAVDVFDQSGLIASVPVPGGPQYITIPTGSTVYVTTRAGSVYGIDLGTRKLLPPLLTEGDLGPMDYDAYTSEVYVPDKKHDVVNVLAPVAANTQIPHEPDHTIPFTGVAPQSVAITSDGQLAFIALAGGNVAMYDIPGKQIVNTIFVGGNPRFIITGLYPPLLGTTPQNASVWSTVINVAAYVLVVALFIVPILLFRRYSRAAKKFKKPGE